MLVGSICSLPRWRVPVNCQLSERFALHRVCRRTRNECSSFSGDTNFPLPRPSPVSSRPPIGKMLICSTRRALTAIIHAAVGDEEVNYGHLNGVVSTGAGYRLVTHRKSAPLSNLVRPGAGLTTKSDPCFSIPADGKPVIAAARVVAERKCVPILRDPRRD